MPFRKRLDWNRLAKHHRQGPLSADEWLMFITICSVLMVTGAALALARWILWITG